MLEKYTVDSVAGITPGVLKEGSVEPKMLRRFYRRGKRDARRRFSHEPAKELIKRAVGMATREICEEYVLARRELRARIAGLEAAIESLKDDLDSQGQSEPPETAAPTAEALTGLRKRRLSTLVTEVTAAEDRLSVLHEEFQQRILSCHETGGLMWSRYCMGFEKGTRRRGSPDDQDVGPRPVIDFEMPCDPDALASTPTSKVGSADRAGPEGLR